MTAEDQIRELLSTYERSLNTSDAALAAQCYTSDGVFMPTTLPTARGNGLEQSYARTFETIQLSVEFTIDGAGRRERHGCVRPDAQQRNPDRACDGPGNAESNR